MPLNTQTEVHWQLVEGLGMTGEARGEIVETLIAYPLQGRATFHQRKRKFTASVVSTIYTERSRV
jgi:hypothetical protein